MVEILSWASFVIAEGKAQGWFIDSQATFDLMSDICG